MTDQLTGAGLALVLLALPALLMCVRMLRGVLERGGRVPARLLGLPDLFVAFFLCVFFALLVVGQTVRVGAEDGGAPQFTSGHAWGNIWFFLALVGLIAGFLAVRGISFVEVFGLRRWPLWRAVPAGVLIGAVMIFLCAALGNVMRLLLQEGAQEQDVVKLFRDVVASGERRNMVVMVFLAVVFQPVVEETIFRGYFYATFKGWAGATASALFTATLFAAIHGSVTALPALLLLALALTLAYEWSGSIFVPISMHMTFNGVNIAILTWAPQLAPQ